MVYKCHQSRGACCALVLLVGCGVPRSSNDPVETSAALPAVESISTSLLTRQGRPLFVTHNLSSDVTLLTIREGGSVTVGPRVSTASNPRGIVFHPNGRTAYVAGARFVAVHAIGPGGELTPFQEPVDTGDETGLLFGSAVAPRGNALYASNPGTNHLFSFPIGADGRLGEVQARLDVVQAKGVAVTPDGRFVYVSQGVPTDTAPDSVSGFAALPDGSLSLLGSWPIGASGAGATITPDGRFLYVVCQRSDQVFGFSIGADGTLVPLEHGPFSAPVFPEGAGVSPDGRFLYVNELHSDVVRVFAIASDGGLTELSASPFSTGTGPIGPAPTPDGAFLFVSNVGGVVLEPFPGIVTAFAVNADGALQLLDPAIPTGGVTPAFQSAAVLTNQGPTARFIAQVRRAGQPSVFDAMASTDPDGFVARYDWDFGDGTRLEDGGPRVAHVYSHAGSFRVSVTVTDNERCSTRLVYTGQFAACNGSDRARAERVVRVSPH
jgi:6-phosphogluconolactonase (cycloisomerase 2 family)